MTGTGLRRASGSCRSHVEIETVRSGWRRRFGFGARRWRGGLAVAIAGFRRSLVPWLLFPALGANVFSQRRLAHRQARAGQFLRQHLIAHVAIAPGGKDLLAHLVQQGEHGFGLRIVLLGQLADAARQGREVYPLFQFRIIWLLFHSRSPFCVPPRLVAVRKDRAGIALVSSPGTPPFPPGDAFAGGVGVIPHFCFLAAHFMASSG